MQEELRCEKEASRETATEGTGVKAESGHKEPTSSPSTLRREVADNSGVASSPVGPWREATK